MAKSDNRVDKRVHMKLKRAPRAPLAASAVWAHGGNVRFYYLHNVGAHLLDDCESANLMQYHYDYPEAAC